MKMFTKVIVCANRSKEEMEHAEPVLLPKHAIRQQKRARAFFAVAEAFKRPSR